VLQKTADELSSRECTSSELTGVGVTIAKSHPSICQIEDALVADGDAKDVGGQILQGCRPIANRLAMHHPRLAPHSCWNEREKWCLAQSVTELSANDPGECLDWKQKVVPRRVPRLAIGCQSATWNEVVYVWVVAQVSTPGVQHTDHADLATYETWITSQMLHCGGRDTKEEIVYLLLVTPSYGSKFAGQGNREQKVRHRKKKGLLLLQPLPSLVILTLGTMAIATGMIQVFRLPARFTAIDVTAHDPSSTSFNRCHHLPMAGQHFVSILGSILRSVATKDLGDFYHVRPPINWLIVVAARTSVACVRWA
jgi:hypothetical protein